MVSLANLNLASIGVSVDFKQDGFGVVKVSGIDMPTECGEGNGNDLLYGNEGNDTILGYGGDDIIDGGTGIDVLKRLSEVTYVHFMFDRHHVVEAEGILTDSLYTGPEALKSLAPEAREEIFAIFPELMDAQCPTPTPARKFLSGRQARKLAQRQIQNKKPLLQPTIH